MLQTRQLSDVGGLGHMENKDRTHKTTSEATEKHSPEAMQPKHTCTLDLVCPSYTAEYERQRGVHFCSVRLSWQDNLLAITYQHLPAPSTYRIVATCVLGFFPVVALDHVLLVTSSFAPLLWRHVGLIIFKMTLWKDRWRLDSVILCFTASQPIATRIIQLRGSIPPPKTRLPFKDRK